MTDKELLDRIQTDAKALRFHGLRMYAKQDSSDTEFTWLEIMEFLIGELNHDLKAYAKQNGYSITRCTNAYQKRSKPKE